MYLCIPGGKTDEWVQKSLGIFLVTSAAITEQHVHHLKKTIALLSQTYFDNMDSIVLLRAIGVNK